MTRIGLIKEILRISEKLKTSEGIETLMIIQDLELLIESYEKGLENDREKNIRDTLNYAKSEMAELIRPKLGKTMTPYRSAKLDILPKVIKILER